MKCVILGAGLGKRLHPLTATQPKPMMLVANKTILEHNIEAVRAAGIQDILINLFYLSDQMMDYFGDGSRFGVHITWRLEQKLSGPAGALLIFEDLLKLEDVVLVMSGDVIHDIPLQEFIAAHKQARVQLSVVMKEVQNANLYGVGKIDRSGFITEFVEKPPLSPTAYGLISCGIYCLDPRLLVSFPRSEIYDFGAHLIPAMVAQKKSVLGWKTTSYWADIGSSKHLLQANLDAVAGNIQVQLPGAEWAQNVYVVGNTNLSNSVFIVGPAVIGSNVSIGRDVQLVGPVVIGDDVKIGNQVYLSRAVVLPGANIADQSVLLEGILSKA